MKVKSDKAVSSYRVIGGFILSSVLCCLYSKLIATDEIPGDELPQEEEVSQAKFYRNPEERREAGLGKPVTEWLTFFGLVEAEYEYSKEKYRDKFSFSDDNDIWAVQVGLEAEFKEWLLGEFVFEVEYDRTWRSILEEGLLALEFDTWAIKAGVQYVQFGEYYSYFVTGPMLEVGETRKSSLMFDQELNEQTEFTAYLFDEEGTFAHDDPGWGVAFEWVSEDESKRVGSGYISNLAQSDDFLDEEDYHTAAKVPGWNFYALMGFDTFELTAEAVVATDRFILEDEYLRPEAYNVELAYFLEDDFQFGARVEYSRNLIDEPDWQYGVTATWRAGKHVIVSIDFLEGSYDRPLFMEEDEEYIKSRRLLGAQVGLEF